MILFAPKNTSRVPGVSVGSPCPWWKPQNFFIPKVSRKLSSCCLRQVWHFMTFQHLWWCVCFPCFSKYFIVLFCEEDVALSDIPTCLMMFTKFQKWTTSRRRSHTLWISTIQPPNFTLHTPHPPPHFTIHPRGLTPHTLHCKLFTPHSRLGKRERWRTVQIRYCIYPYHSRTCEKRFCGFNLLDFFFKIKMSQNTCGHAPDPGQQQGMERTHILHTWGHPPHIIQDMNGNKSVVSATTLNKSVTFWSPCLGALPTCLLVRQMKVPYVFTFNRDILSTTTSETQLMFTNWGTTLYVPLPVPLLFCFSVRAALCTASMVVSYWLTMAFKHLHARTAALLVFGPSSGWFLTALLLATVAVPYQVQVHWERYLGLAPLFGRGKWPGIGNFGCNRHQSKNYMPGRERVAGRGLLAPDMTHGSANVFKSGLKQLLMSPCCVQSWRMVTDSRKTPACPWDGHSTFMSLSDNVVFTDLLDYKN